MGETTINKKKEKIEKQLQREAYILLENSEQILADVDACDFSQKVSERSFPKFDTSEIELGPLLGVGGFCMVYEIEKFVLKDNEEEEQAEGSSSAEPKEDAAATDGKKTEVSEPLDLDNHADGEHHHYHVESARKIMSDNVRRAEDARYAIKRLHKKLNPFERARGRLDLAIEVKFLSRLWHPNISKFIVFSSVFLKQHTRFSSPYLLNDCRDFIKIQSKCVDIPVGHCWISISSS
jgi:hypothetical protein